MQYATPFSSLRAYPRGYATLALLFTLFVGLLAFEPIHAWTLFNDIDNKDFNDDVYDIGLKLIEEGSLDRSLSRTCSWEKTACNPNGGRGIELTAVIKSGSRNELEGVYCPYPRCAFSVVFDRSCYPEILLTASMTFIYPRSGSPE